MRRSLIIILFGLAGTVPANSEPPQIKPLSGVFCDTEEQIKLFLEFHFGKKLGIPQAMSGVNAFVGSSDACLGIHAAVSADDHVGDHIVEGRKLQIHRVKVEGFRADGSWVQFRTSKTWFGFRPVPERPGVRV